MKFRFCRDSLQDSEKSDTVALNYNLLLDVEAFFNHLTTPTSFERHLKVIRRQHETLQEKCFNIQSERLTMRLYKCFESAFVSSQCLSIAFSEESILR